MKTINKLLVANRGEIACRLFRAARRLGIKTVAVYSEADARALHVRSADEAVLIGPSPASQSYLSVDAILAAARRVGADAIHPGYGFLSENAAAAQAFISAGIIWVGPPPSAMDDLGNKARAKALALSIGVPCLKGYQDADQSDGALQAAATKIGFPLLIKATAGGGGRGMRRVDDADHFLDALARARSEATSAFGSGDVLLEHLVTGARHVEIQVLADSHGHVITLGERDCSVQRRHQKVIEEAPGPHVSAELRARMSQAARKLAQAAHYTNAGTVEFLVDSSDHFFFLEMNTRLQVEHPVTEEVTGADLVELQLRVARGESLAHLPDELPVQGHSIEVRLYAEDPAQQFLPQTGKIWAWQPPAGEGIRVDAGIEPGTSVSPFYDPMLAKIISTGKTRQQAVDRLRAALAHTTILGIRTNLAYLQEIIDHPTFQAGDAVTTFLDTESLASGQPVLPSSMAASIAAVVMIEDESREVSPLMKGWRSTGPARVPIRLHSNDARFDVEVEHAGTCYAVSINGARTAVDVISFSSSRMECLVDGVHREITFARSLDDCWLHTHEGIHHFMDRTYAPPEQINAARSGVVRSPTSGRVMSVRARVGDSVRHGDVLLIVEAMKMENHVVAPRDGVIETVSVAENQQVDAQQILVTLAAIPTAAV